MARDDRPRVTTAANLVLAGGALVSVLALVYFVYHYSWIRDREFASGIGPIVYYGLPAVVSLVLFSSLLFRPSVKQNLALVLCSTALSVLCAEVVLEAVKPKHTLWTPATRQDMEALVKLARRFGIEYDTRTQLQVVRDLRLQGVDAVPALYPMGVLAQQPGGALRSRLEIDDVEVFALSGVSRRLTVFCNESGEWITYQSDEHGFHNPRGLWNSAGLDIAVLGDSFAQGACVPSDRNFVAVIRARHPATLNLGNSNKGPLQALADLREYAAAFRPGIVLWFFYGQNDFADLGKERNSPLLTRYLDRDFSQRLHHLRADLDRVLQDYWVGEFESIETRWPEAERPIVFPAVLRFHNLRERIGLMQYRAPPIDRTEVDDTISLLTEILSEAKVTVDSWGGNLYLVYLPAREQYVESHAASLNEMRRESLLSAARSVGVAVIDIHSAFESTGDPLALFPFRRRGHYNEEGHRLVGETVLRSISRQ